MTLGGREVAGPLPFSQLRESCGVAPRCPLPAPPKAPFPPLLGFWARSRPGLVGRGKGEGARGGRRSRETEDSGVSGTERLGSAWGAGARGLREGRGRAGQEGGGEETAAGAEGWSELRRAPDKGRRSGRARRAASDPRTGSHTCGFARRPAGGIPGLRDALGDPTPHVVQGQKRARRGYHRTDKRRCGVGERAGWLFPRADPGARGKREGSAKGPPAPPEAAQGPTASQDGQGEGDGVEPGESGVERSQRRAGVPPRAGARGTLTHRPVVAARVHLVQHGPCARRHRGGRPPGRLAEDQRQQDERELAAAHGPGGKPSERAVRPAECALPTERWREDPDSESAAAAPALPPPPRGPDFIRLPGRGGEGGGGLFSHGPERSDVSLQRAGALGQQSPKIIHFPAEGGKGCAHCPSRPALVILSARPTSDSFCPSSTPPRQHDFTDLHPSVSRGSAG